ncbi:MAG TPA: ADP-ribosylglycohydrolase family protein [Polyangiaceae bacterium]|nr:ADP-ribosylglycohydrolase family protein [Polyangiaceae bacterium]
MHIAEQEASFVGALLGLALGDAFGAPFEGGVLERALWRIMGKTADGHFRWTDDTQMALDLAESLTDRGSVDQDDIARRFARGYRWSRGYGPGAAKILKLIRSGVDWRLANTRVYREGSFGNGGAMRAPVVGLFCASDLASVGGQARATAIITHAHPLGQEGAALVALATALLLHGHSPSGVVEALLDSAEHDAIRARLVTAKSWLEGATPSPRDVRAQLGNGIAASESCITAIYIALRFLERPFSDLLAFAAACRGDVDTIGAIAGAIWGARNGDSMLPADKLERLEDAARVRQVALGLHRVALAKATT